MYRTCLKVGAPGSCLSCLTLNPPLVLPRACRIQQKNLNSLGLPKKRVASVPQSKQLVRMLEPSLPKEKGLSHSSKSKDHEMGDDQGG